MLGASALCYGGCGARLWNLLGGRLDQLNRHRLIRVNVSVARDVHATAFAAVRVHVRVEVRVDVRVHFRREEDGMLCLVGPDAFNFLLKPATRNLTALLTALDG